MNRRRLESMTNEEWQTFREDHSFSDEEREQLDRLDVIRHPRRYRGRQ